MKISHIDFPRLLLSALRDRKLVVFAGAGVSMGEPAKLSNFTDLAKQIAHGTGHQLQDGEPEDQFLGKLKHDGIDVHALASQILQKNSDGEVPRPTPLHTDLLRLFGQPGRVRIVTTNFDLLFKDAADNLYHELPDVFTAPALPLGRDFNAIAHIHGTIHKPQNTVLTDADFGRAYLTDGWARRFLVQLFREYFVLFVGYSHNDTVMHYLCRALPERILNRRFILLPESKAKNDRWARLGIHPIPYPKLPDDDHIALTQGIGALADYATRGVLDWRHQIADIARKPPPVDEESASLIDDAFTDSEKTPFFTRTANDPDWIDWLDKRDHFKYLFDTRNLRKQDRGIARWLATTYVRPHSIELFSLIARHNTRLHPLLWDRLIIAVGSKDDPQMPVELLSKWASFLVATTPLPLDDLKLFHLARRCAEQGLMHQVIRIFDALSAPRYTLEQRSPWPGTESSGSSRRVHVRLPILSDTVSFISRLWEKALQPQLERVALPLLPRVTLRLLERHQTFRAWNQADRFHDPDHVRRSAVEPHDQNAVPRPVDVLIDVTRECLEHLASAHPDTVVRWCNDFADSEAPLLRRLALFALSVRGDLTADQKCDWLVRHMNIHDRALHHEVFQAIRQIYPNLGSTQRTSLIHAIRAYRYSGDEDKDRQSAARQYDWFQWLRDADPACEMLTQELDDIAARYPEFTPRDHPDLIQSTVRWVAVDTQSPWTTDELLKRPASEWLTDLLSFSQTDIRGPDRIGLLRSVEEAAKQEFKWGLDLAGELIDAAHWKTDLWTALARAWSKSELNADRYRLVLARLGTSELHYIHADAIADFLYESFRPRRDLDMSESLDLANQLANDLWHRLDKTSPDETENHDLLTQAINHPAGNLAQFHIFSLWQWRNQQQHPPTSIPENYHLALSDIVQDTTENGRLARCVLCRSLAFLVEADKVWTEDNLAPLFDVGSDPLEFTAAWSGFLYGNVSISAVEMLKHAFLKATTRLGKEFTQHNMADRFIEAYTYVLFFYVQDPLQHWIPNLFENLDEDGRRSFSWHIGYYLRQIDTSQLIECWKRWLNRYWETRVHGAPKPLVGAEIDTMLTWLPHLDTVFPDAVDIAVKMPRIPLDNGFILDDLFESTIHERHPAAVARLLDHLRHCFERQYVWKNSKPLILQLLESNIPPNLKLSLREILATFELDDALD